MNEIVLHIGMPKTGTSSLQKYLAENNDMLIQYGWCYPDARGNFYNVAVTDDGRWANGGLYPYVLGLKGGNMDWLESYNYFIKTVDQAIEKSNVILSEESIWLDQEGFDFLSFMVKRYKQVRVIVYLRRQDDEIASLYSQLVRNIFVLHGLNKNECALNIEEFSEEILNGNSGYSGAFDYETRLANIENIVGIPNISVFSYEANKESIKEHFVRSLGIDFDKLHPTGDVNMSCDAVDIEAKRKFNELFLNKSYVLRRFFQNEFENLVFRK